MGYSYKIIDDLMSRFKSVIGIDYGKYRNHVCRVFLYCVLLDKDKRNEKKYAIAAVYHDIGIWTDRTIDYLNPSIVQANNYLREIGKTEWIEEIDLMIYWHHKITGYKGEYKETVVIFCKADWMDVSLGVLTFEGDKKKIAEIRHEFPNLGFHLFLIKEVLKNAVNHPLNPFPMFKK
ncbi:phosphohydrolase [Pedobacter hiemivivus]|uniref:Phosphohydrolase n=1 Tax=Pedobacter hiemivivus TaxID=2530454 RepID=A0A4U1GLF5_9SPHI|nr:HD domain-containing protein [Pedobacter hiemivivus]TKC65201.1 phosphohydrolase [Pedobacter hiemivivus]